MSVWPIITALRRSGNMGAAADRRWFRLSEVSVRFARAMCGIALLTAVAGCTDDQPDAAAPPSFVAPASAPAWTEPPDYTFVADRQCEGGPALGKYRVTVTGREVASVERVDGETTGEEKVEVPTLAQLLELAQTAADDGGTTTVQRDPADGRPVAVSIDVSDGSEPEAGGEGATCFTISDYQPRG
jgi:uncharacterized protein DUF6174